MNAVFVDAFLVIYHRSAEKQWTLIDCVSFVVMRERKVTDALTGDRHFPSRGNHLSYWRKQHPTETLHSNELPPSRLWNAPIV